MYYLLGVEQTITWSSSDENVATVDQNGVVTGVGYGEAVITASVNDGLGRVTQRGVAVTKPVGAIRFRQSVYEMQAGDPMRYLYVMLESDTPRIYAEHYGRMSWSSSAPDVLEYSFWYSQRGDTDFGGGFTPMGAGVAVVKAMTIDGGDATASCVVVVHGDNAVTLPASAARVDAEAFSGTAIQEITLGENVTEIGARAFADCAELRLARIDASDAVIAEDAFEGCQRVTILCAEGSAAQTFARAHGIACAVLDA